MICRSANNVWIAAAVLLLSFAPYLNASDREPGELSGSIYDETGAALAGVRVTIRGAASRQEDTGESGRFDFPDLPEGDYELVAERSGFERARRVVPVRAGEHPTLALVMRVAIVEETVVTAEKAGGRGIQTVPIAISAVSDEELARDRITTIDQAAPLVPSVTFSQNSGFGQLTIRGIGTNAVYAGADPSSVIYLDGIYLARPAMAFVELLDLDRIEVLRGPQGTLYGRNAVGGAINLITKPPSNEFEALGRVTTGTFHELRGEAMTSGPLKRDRIMGSVAFTRATQNGYVRDLNHPGEPLGGDDLTAAHGQLRVVFGRRADLLFSSDVSNQAGSPLTFNKVLAVKPGYTVDNPADLHEVRTSLVQSQQILQYGGSARLTAALTPSTTLVSLTGYRRLKYDFSLDSDITELNLSTFDQHESQHQLSEEITVSHQQGGLDWIGGAYLFTESDDQALRSPQIPQKVEIRLLPRVHATSRALYGQVTIPLTRRLSATGGVRYTAEEKSIDNAGGLFRLDAPDVAVPGSAYGYADAINDSAWTPKIGLELKLPHDALTYVSATRGFKSGGFNFSSMVPGRGFAPEWVWSYEAGLKSTVMGGRSRIALSAFLMDYTNLQVQTTIQPGVYDISNAAAATIRGVEAEAATKVAHGFELSGHVTWLDAVYGRYIAVATGGATGDVAGNRLNNAPQWSGRAWIQWTGGLGSSGRLSLAADATAQSTVYYTPFNDAIQRQTPFALLGASAEVGPSHRRWSLAAYARNLTNTDYVTATFGTSPAAFGGRPGPPRQIGLDVTFRK